MKSPFKSGNAGFSLVELMIVVGIIGILAALGVPKFRQFQAKAKQSEVKQNLAFIHTLETSYYGDNGVYSANGAISTVVASSATSCNVSGGVNTIGFTIADCKSAHYGYSISGSGIGVFTATGTESDGTGTNMKKAFSACPATLDTWTLDQDKLMVNSVNALTTAGCI